MHENERKVSAGGMLVLALAVLNAVILKEALVSDPAWYRYAWATVPLLLLSVILMRAKYL